MFGLGRKKAIVEIAVPPTSYEAALALLEEYVGPVKNYVPSTEDQTAVGFAALATVFFLCVTYHLLRPSPPASEGKDITAEEDSVELTVDTNSDASDVGRDLGESYDDFPVNSTRSEDSEYRAFEEIVANLPTKTEASSSRSDSSPKKPSAESDASLLTSVASSPRGDNATVSTVSSKRVLNLVKSPSSKSLGKLRRSSMKKLKSVKKVFN